MSEASIADIEKERKMIREFDHLKLRGEVPRDLGYEQIKYTDSCPTLPGMTWEYRELVGKLTAAIIPLEDLDELVYKPLKNKYPDKFQGDNQDVEFYSVCILNGKKFYQKLNGKDRDIAVQKDIFDQVKRRKEIEICIQMLLFKLQTKLQELSSIKASCHPAKVLIFENMIKSIEMAISMGISCDTTLNQLDRLIETCWLLFFKKDMEKKRKNIRCSRLVDDPLNICNYARHINDPSSKRMKGNPKGNGTTGSNELLSDISCTRITAEMRTGTHDAGGENAGASCSREGHSDSEESENSDWIIE